MITWDGGEEPIRLMLKEGMRHKWRLVLGFVLICSAGVALGLAWPKTYASAVTVSLQQDNIIDTLMQGRAVRTEVDGPPENAGELGLGRSLLERALEEKGAIDADTSARERDRLISDLAGRTDISQPGENLVTIHYRGAGPQAAQEMTNRLGELFIEETLQGRAQESDAAFQFIDRQAQRYERRMEEIQSQIEQLRAENPVAEPGAVERLNQRETTLTQQVSDLEQQVEEARIREQSLQERLAQMSGSDGDGTGAVQARLAQLRQELETLRLSYHESYPDIVRLKRQIAQLEEQAQQGGSQSAGAPSGGSQQAGLATGGAQPGGSQSAQDGGSGNAAQPGSSGQSLSIAGGGLELRQGVQQSLYETRTNIQTLQSRLESVRSQLASVREDQTALEDVQKQISELERSHQINANIHEDLLSRRENARVSRELGSAQRGLTMRIEQPAQLPTTPEIPRPLHFALAGGVLGAGVPIGLLFLVVMLDPRIRDVAHVPVETGSVLLTTIPHARTRMERRVAPLGVFACVLIVIATVIGLAALMWVMGGYGI